MNLQSLIEKAGESKLRLWTLNKALLHAIPFNSPHKIMVTEARPGKIVAKLPFIRKNKNHIGGMHACALATVSEYVSGLCLASVLSSEEYRFILKELKLEYHYQGRSDCSVIFEMLVDELDRLVLMPLKSAEKIEIDTEIKVFDKEKNHISTATAIWQIKEWKSINK